MKKNLSTYFNTAQTVRNTERLVSHDELHSIVANIPTVSVQTAPNGAVVTTTQKGKIMVSLSILATAALSAWWYFAPSVQKVNVENLAQQKEPFASEKTQIQQQTTTQIISQLRQRASVTQLTTAMPEPWTYTGSISSL